MLCTLSVLIRLHVYDELRRAVPDWLFQKKKIVLQVQSLMALLLIQHLALST